MRTNKDKEGKSDSRCTSFGDLIDVYELAVSLCGLRSREDLCCCYDGYCSACRLRDAVEKIESRLKR